MNKLNYEICLLLKLQIKNSNLSYKGLAERMNISEINLMQYLNHHSPLPMIRAIELAAILGLSLSQLVEEAELRVTAFQSNNEQQCLRYCR